MAQSITPLSSKNNSPRYDWDENYDIATLQQRAIEILSKCNPKPVIAVDLDYTVSFSFTHTLSLYVCVREALPFTRTKCGRFHVLFPSLSLLPHTLTTQSPHSHHTVIIHCVVHVFPYFSLSHTLSSPTLFTHGLIFSLYFFFTALACELFRTYWTSLQSQSASYGHVSRRRTQRCT